MKPIQWIVSAALSAYACHLAVLHTTPIDHALPLIAVALTFLAAVSYPAVMLSVPLLIAGEVAIADEPLRLLVFGIVVAASFGAALLRAAYDRHEWKPAIPIAITAIVLLRWIPLNEVMIGRELFLLAVSAPIVFVLGQSPFAVAVAVVAALVTPAVPLRTLLLPVIVLFVATMARLFRMPRFWFAAPAAVVVGFVMLFFAWSGVVARELPYFFRKTERPTARTVIAQAIPPGRSATFSVPAASRSVVLSGANVAGFEDGALLGRIQPGAIDVRIGDVSDWGYARREHFYGSRNPLPSVAAGKLRGYGYDAWVDGAGVVRLPKGARTIQVTADPSLPPGASLQVEGFE